MLSMHSEKSLDTEDGVVVLGSGELTREIHCRSFLATV